MRSLSFSPPILFVVMAFGCAGQPTPTAGSADEAALPSSVKPPTEVALAPNAPDPAMSGPGLTSIEIPEDQPAEAEAIGKAVKRRLFTESNDATKNEVLVYAQADDGSLSGPTRYATGGLGTAAGLGSQGAVTLSADGSALFAVNAGSNDLSVFAVGKKALYLTDRIASGGVMPVSVAISGNVVYVVNAGGVGNVAGFVVSHTGKLTALPGVPRALKQAGAGAAQVAVTPSAGAVIVTEKATNCIETFGLHADGSLDAGVCVPSAGQTPFGFAFAPSVIDAYGYVYDRLLVSEAFGGAADASAVSSYLVDGSDLYVAAASVPTKQTAACWVALDRAGKFAYTTNTASASVTGYRVSLDGALTLLNADGRTATLADGSKPTDVATAKTANLVHVLSSGTHQLSSFAVAKSGALSLKGTFDGLPAFAAGLASE